MLIKIFIYLNLLILIIYKVVATGNLTLKSVGKTSFEVDYENEVFLLDGKPFRYVAGSFHYFRAPKFYWRDRLRKIRAAGLNAVSTYVEWSLHQPEPNKWQWTGEADIIEFIKIAEEEDLLVILRPGPYICAEREFGGFPYWLLQLVPDIKLRTRDDRYLHYAEVFLNKILTKVKPYLRGNGGPIIMVQIENEYGSFGSCDDVYKSKLTEIFKRHVSDRAVLFTTDGVWTNMLKCGTIPGIFKTIDFGVTNDTHSYFLKLKRYQPKGPLVNSEFYPGWLTHWGDKYQQISAEAVTKTLDNLLANNVSVNFYMFFGGTNFGFTNGANIDSNRYTPQLTSYDYNAPITEAGDLTDKYFKIQKVISKYFPIPKISVGNTTKRAYGVVPLTPVLQLFDEDAIQRFGTPTIMSIRPPNFEFLGLSGHLVLYETIIPKHLSESAPDYNVSVYVKDRALAYVGAQFCGVFSRTYKIDQLRLPNAGEELKLLVENQGRVNYGNTDVEDFKGMSDVTMNDEILTPWSVTGFKLDSVNEDSFRGLVGKKIIDEVKILNRGPQFLLGQFFVKSSEIADTFLSTQGWGKGVAYLNGHNLGRYWPRVGPQVTLFVPASFLKAGRNSIILLELEFVSENRTVQLQREPILDSV